MSLSGAFSSSASWPGVLLLLILQVERNDSRVWASGMHLAMHLPCRAVVPGTLPLFGSQMNDAGQFQICKAFAILKLWLWQPACCYGGRRAVSLWAGRSCMQPIARTGAFSRRLLPAGVRSALTSKCWQALGLPLQYPARAWQQAFCASPFPHHRLVQIKEPTKLRSLARVWNFEWFLLNTISLHCTVNETAKLQSLWRMMIDHESEKQFSVPLTQREPDEWFINISCQQQKGARAAAWPGRASLPSTPHPHPPSALPTRQFSLSWWITEENVMLLVKRASRFVRRRTERELECFLSLKISDGRIDVWDQPIRLASCQGKCWLSDAISVGVC